MAAASSSPARLASTVFDWTRLPVVPTPVGERRAIFDAPTKTLRRFECHATTLNPGQTAHPAHRHPDEELVIVKEGALEVTIDGRVQRASPGTVIFFGSNDLHGMRNPGPARVSYHVMRILTGDTPAT